MARSGHRVAVRASDRLVVESRDGLVAGEKGQRDAQALAPEAAREGRAGGARGRPSVLLARGPAPRRRGGPGGRHRTRPVYVYVSLTECKTVINQTS